MRMVGPGDADWALVERYVTVGEPPRYRGVGRRYREDAEFRRRFDDDVEVVADGELEVLLELDYRPRRVAGWLIGVGRRERFRGRLAELLLESEVGLAGQAYCLALARFGTERDADVLVEYLDRYLDVVEPPRYDQDWALGALRWIDAGRAGRYAAAWERFGGTEDTLAWVGDWVRTAGLGRFP